MFEKIQFNIIEKRKIFFIISIAMIIVGLVSMFTRGFNLDIDFTGGTSMQIDLEKQYEVQDSADLNNIILEITGENASSIQQIGSGGTEVIIKTKELTSEQREEVFNKIKETYNLTADAPLSTDNVGASIGSDLRKAAILSALVAAILMLVYITIRFEAMTGVSAVICLIHDLLIILSAYSLFQIPMSTTFIAAILTILGYSINATIIVFDRVRENMRLIRKSGFSDIVNKSIWQTFARSVYTSLTTLATVVVLYILGVPSIKNFALPIIIGIIAGTYSSVFLSGNVWVLLKQKFSTKH